MTPKDETFGTEIKPDTKKLPETLQSTKDVKTTMKNMKQVISEKLAQLKDLATMQILMPVEARMRDRLKTIKEESSAFSLKIRGHWTTTPPKMHIRNLAGKMHSNTEAEISFSVYETDEKGNKVLYEHFGEVQLNDGSKVKRSITADYRIAYDVKEIIKDGKHIEREILDVAPPASA